MFYTFAATPPSRGGASQRNLRRTKVARACNYCRQHRVRCDVELPCSRCLENNIECVASSPLGRQPPERPDISHNDPSSARRPTVPHMESTSPNQIPSKLDEIDSTVGFMSQISAFCSTISQLSPDYMDDSPPPPYPSPDGNLLLDGDSGITALLSKTQVAHLLDIYWTRCHPLSPIVHRPQVYELFETLWASSGAESQSTPLIDGIVALSLNYLGNSGLNRRLLGFRWEQKDLSLSYFGRCLAATNQYVAFAEPSLERLQCYVIMTIYLLEAGGHQPAYNMIGLALRMAQTLNIHHGLPDSNPNVYVAQRVWWTIIHLNSRCARLLGRPIGVQLAEVTCPLPPIGEFPYHTRAVALTRATLAVTEALSRHTDIPAGDPVAQAISRASTLSAEVYRLHEWRDEQLRPALGRPLHVDNRGAHDWILSASDTSPPRIVQEIFLELQYYNDIIGLHRPFIRFPDGLLIQPKSPERDAHVTTSLHYAMATIDLTHRIMSITDALCGLSEVYQWQWNALLTLIGFLMSHPFCIYAPTARHHTQLALEIFSSADTNNTVAARAAVMTRSLCAKVDALVEMLRLDGDRAASPSAGGHPNNSIWEDLDIPNDLSRPDSDELWSWTDTTNPEAWSTYTDRITGVLADFPNLPLSNDGFSPFL